jgi:hypothetical protein
VQAIAAIADIGELNIGHAIVAHALFAGWENAVREMKAIMVAAKHGGFYILHIRDEADKYLDFSGEGEGSKVFE